jgi:predicted neuraminidase
MRYRHSVLCRSATRLIPMGGILTLTMTWYFMLPERSAVGVEWPETAGVEVREFIYDTAPFPSCHASTLVETDQGIAAAWFGGTHEKHPDVGIWFARRTENGWTTPVEVVNGVQNAELRYPCWNPVLFQIPSGNLLLFYKVGPSPSTWWGMLTTSDDHGATWSEPRRLPEGILGPVKNRPELLADGRLLCGSSSEHEGWRVHMEWTSDEGKTWERTEALNDGKEFGAIQPSILRHDDNRLQIVCRSMGVGKVLQAWSDDGGRTWSELTPTDLPNPNSGTDAVTLQDGRHLVVYNHTPRGRTPLNVALSSDGKEWLASLVLENEPGEYSYPAVIQGKDGRIHVSYTWQRKKVRYVVLDPEKLPQGPRLPSE